MRITLPSRQTPIKLFRLIVDEMVSIEASRGDTESVIQLEQSILPKTLIETLLLKLGFEKRQEDDFVLSECLDEKKFDVKLVSVLCDLYKNEMIKLLKRDDKKVTTVKRLRKQAKPKKHLKQTERNEMESTSSNSN